MIQRSPSLISVLPTSSSLSVLCRSAADVGWRHPHSFYPNPLLGLQPPPPQLSLQTHCIPWMCTPPARISNCNLG